MKEQTELTRLARLDLILDCISELENSETFVLFTVKDGVLSTIRSNTDADANINILINDIVNIVSSQENKQVRKHLVNWFKNSIKSAI